MAPGENELDTPAIEYLTLKVVHTAPQQFINYSSAFPPPALVSMAFIALESALLSCYSPSSPVCLSGGAAMVSPAYGPKKRKVVLFCYFFPVQFFF